MSYEEPPTLRADDLLSAGLLKGPHHTVDPEVRTDGFMAYFALRSDYGIYKAASVDEAAIRVREIYAIAALDDMKRHQLAGKGVAEGVKQPFLAAKNVVTRPAETMQNLGKGIGRWVERGKLSLRQAKKKAEESAEDVKETYNERRQARRAAKLAEEEVRERAIAAGRDPDTAVAEYRQRRDAEESSGLAAESDAQRQQERIRWAADKLEKAAYKFIGYDKARRQLAHDLGVDPYSTNLQLQERLDAMAWALWAGQFGSGFVTPSIEALDYAGQVDSLVWASHPKDLEVRNRKQLKAMGVDRDTIDAFFENSFYSTSDRTQMVADLASLDQVAGLSHFFSLAAGADGWLLGAYYRRSAGLLADAHRRRPLDRIFEPGETLVAALSRDGALLLVLAVDYLAWTEGIDLVASGIERQRRAAGFDGNVVLLLGGDLTARARQGVEALGWTLETRRPLIGRSPDNHEGAV
ncbi:MAG: hypothetical protein AAF657_22615 [Acidobacteriota bacterium]